MSSQCPQESQIFCRCLLFCCFLVELKCTQPFKIAIGFQVGNGSSDGEFILKFDSIMEAFMKKLLSCF
ncbi:CLUMA_CG000809, isoform A [Clunio marinus]|uniref:CLUMA_CG000809, isoform A n=1 Tax=Clunio marinus TaxID=568069 RepID=A0A1J1HHV7_9DIPT|nr:CLUMA_CG000809, isoform A [Clunio marinus]